MGIRVRLCSDWCLREADILSDYPQTAVSHIVRTQHFYFAQRDTAPACFGPFMNILKFLVEFVFSYDLIKLLVIQQFIECVCYNLVLIVILDVVQARVAVCVFLVAV